MDCFNGVYDMKYCQTNSTRNLICHKNRCLLYWYKISRWYVEMLRYCCWVKICEFTKNKQGVSQCFHLHMREQPTAVPRWVVERITGMIAEHWWQDHGAPLSTILMADLNRLPAPGQWGGWHYARLSRDMRASWMDYFWTPLQQWYILFKKRSDPLSRTLSLTQPRGSSARGDGNVMEQWLGSSRWGLAIPNSAWSPSSPRVNSAGVLPHV